MRRPAKEEADEDGPPTDSETLVEEVDSDPMSDEETPGDHAQIPEGILGSHRPLGRVVHVGWRRRKRACDTEDSRGDAL